MTDELGGAKTTKINLGLNQIPGVALREIGARFIKGEKNYGRDNWKLGDKTWRIERLDHAINHLYNYRDGNTSDDTLIQNLAAVAWFCVIEIWHLSQEQMGKTDQLK